MNKKSVGSRITVRKDEVLSQYKKLVLEAIAKQVTRPLVDVEYVFDRVHSFDDTVFVLYTSAEMNLQPDYVIRNKLGLYGKRWKGGC